MAEKDAGVPRHLKITARREDSNQFVNQVSVLFLCLSIPQHLFMVVANRQGPDENVQLCTLVSTFFRMSIQDPLCVQF